jgi:biopolymer transport protein ExbD
MQVSNGMHPIAAPLAALFGLLACVVVIVPDTPRGLAVRIARNQPCGADDRRVVVVQVLSNGDLRINQENVDREHLDRRLEDLFKTRVYRWIFVVGDPDLQFGEVAGVIDAASRKVDYIAIPTPSVLKRADWKNGVCIDPNLPPSYIAHPPR